jgi:putative DNA-invertase from lambdoid prophage Rac
MTAFEYIRVSTARQASEGQSLEVRRRQVEGYVLVPGSSSRRSSLRKA